MNQQTTDLEFGDAIHPGEITVLLGSNFSGRSDFLRAFTGLGASGSSNLSDNTICAYIGSEVYNSLSGLAATVLDELRVHSRSDAAFKTSLDLVSQLRLTHLLKQNPFTLSGGEQALVAVAAAIALQPDRLGIDCAFEQIDSQPRAITLRHIQSQCASGSSVIIADNRFDEYASKLNGRAIQLRAKAGMKLRSLQIPCDFVPAASTPVSISLRNLTFSYPHGPEILRNVSIDLRPGVIYRLSGANGAGKSTLSKLLAGVIRPTGGDIIFQGRKSSPWKSPGHIVAYHFQCPDTQLFATTVRDELNLGVRPGTPGLLTATELAQLFGLSAVLSDHPLDLPFVARKRIALAATLSMPASWLILDEPTLGQDQQSMAAVATIVNTIADGGTGVILITHSEQFCDLLDVPIQIHLQDGVMNAN